MKTLCAWMILGLCSVVSAGEYQSVLVNKVEPVAVVAPVATTCNDGCCKVQVYNEEVVSRKSCRKSLFGKVIKREVKRTTLSPVR